MTGKRERHPIPNPTTRAEGMLATVARRQDETNDLLAAILDRLPEPFEVEPDVEPGEVRRVELREPERHAVDVERVQDEPAEDEEPRPARPAVRASKADWVAYAVEQDMDADEAEAMTKTDLIAALGG